MTTTDTIRFICTECQYRARLPAKYEGKHIKCPGCKATQQVIADDGESTGSTVAIKRLNESQMTKPDKFRFICGDCGYRARIPVKYAGMAIKCPGCGSAQMAEGSTEPEGDGDKPKGDTVQITKVDVQPGSSADGRFRFQCDTCGYRAKLPERFLGQNIKCPGCGGAQQALPLDDSVPISGDTMVVKVVEEVPDHELTAQAKQQGGSKPPAAAPPPPAPADNDDDLLLEPTITPPRGVKAINPADVPPEDTLQDDEPIIRPGSSAQNQAVPVAQPVGDSGRDDEPEDPVQRKADGSLHYDPFAAEREATGRSEDSGESQALLEEMRQTRSRPGRGSSNSRQVVTPGGGPQSGSARGGGGGAPPPPESGGSGQTTRRRRSVQGATDAPHSDPTAEENAMPATATAPAHTPVKQGGKGGVIFLIILLLGALVGGGWLYMQWQKTIAERDGFEGDWKTATAQLEQTQERLSAEQAAHAETKTDLGGQIAKLTTDLTDLAAAKAELEAAKAAVEARFQVELQEAEGRLTAARASFNEKVDELTAKTEEVAQLQGQVQAGKEQITQLQGQVSAAKEGAGKAAKAEIAQLKEQNKALQAELKALKKKLSDSATGGVENLLNP